MSQENRRLTADPSRLKMDDPVRYSILAVVMADNDYRFPLRLQSRKNREVKELLKRRVLVGGNSKIGFFTKTESLLGDLMWEPQSFVPK